MSKSQLHDFAATKEKGLPEHKGKKSSGERKYTRDLSDVRRF